MSPTTPIPRFLLPQSSALWRARIQTNTLIVRHASKKAKAPASLAPKPLVLEKPTKFNPPSHGSRIRQAPRYPGPQLSEEEKARQQVKKYPSMMPPEGTFMGWFLRSRSVHLYIVFVVLSTLATIVWSTNFRRDSPFADMLPSWSQFFSHPFLSTRKFFDVVKLSQDYWGREAQDRRTKRVEDVAKRAEYRKAHGLDADESFGGWTAKSDAQLLGPGIPIGDMGGNTVGVGAGEQVKEPEQEVKRERRPVKKWLGIW